MGQTKPANCAGTTSSPYLEMEMPVASESTLEKSREKWCPATPLAKIRNITVMCEEVWRVGENKSPCMGRQHDAYFIRTLNVANYYDR